MTERQTGDFWLRFWGVRGTLPCADPSVARYGGNTACLEVNCGARTLIFDLGSGAIGLAGSVLERGIGDVDIFLTHAHFDHVMGLPFFWPFYRKTFSARIWSGPLEGVESTGALVEDLMRAPFLPITPRIFQAALEYRDIETDETIDLDNGIRIRTTELNHPGGCTGYRIEFSGKSICYVSDTEHLPSLPDRNILKLIDGADIVIYDATYTDDEYLPCRGYGHSTWREGLALCDAAKARQFVAFHHHMEHDDDFLDRMLEEMNAARPGSLVAAEGLVLTP